MEPINSKNIVKKPKSNNDENINKEDLPIIHASTNPEISKISENDIRLLREQANTLIEEKIEAGVVDAQSLPIIKE